MINEVPLNAEMVYLFTYDIFLLRLEERETEVGGGEKKTEKKRSSMT